MVDASSTSRNLDAPRGLAVFVRLVPLAAAVFALSATIAGCVTSPGPSVVPEARQEPAWALKAIFGTDHPDVTRVVNHDHSNRSLHVGLSTPNFHVLGHDPLLSPYYGTTAGAGYCGDVGSSGSGTRQLAVVHSLTTDVALTVLDVTNRSHPQMLGELVLPYEFTYDAAIFSDSRYAVVAGNPDLSSDKAPGARVPFHATWRDTCGNVKPVGSTVDSVPYGYSAILVDLQDPSSPVVADAYEYPAGRNVHSISTAIVDGTRYVATSGLEAVPCTLPGVAGNPVPNPVPCEPAVPRFGNLLSHFDFLTVTDTPAGVRLVPYAVYTPMDQAHQDPSLLYLSNGHTDATIEKHPVTNQTVAYLADWDGGLHVVRLDGPQQVTPLASWGAVPGDDPSQMRGNIHSVRPVDGLRNGRHYLLVGQEVVGRPTGRPSGQVDLLDVTVPGQPVEAAKWTLPVDVQWPPSAGELFSTHYPILVGDTLYVSLYHGGVWAADASRGQWPDLPSIGAFIPAMDPAGKPHAGGTSPEVLEVLDLGDGNILVFDGPTGAYTLHFDGASPDVPPAAPWPDNPWIA